MRRECKLPVEHSLAPQDVNMEGVRISGSSDIILCNLLQMVEKDATFGFIRTSIYSEFQDSRLLNCNCILISGIRKILMNTKIQASSLLAAALLVVGTVGFASCDDDNGGGGTLPSASDLYGNYVGTVRTVEVTHNEKTESSEGGTSEGAEVSVKVDRDTIYFDAFPVKDIIVSLYGEEEAPAIIEMLGDIKYSVGYTPALSEAQDSVSFRMAPEPLKATVSVPSESPDAEPAVLNIESQISAEDVGDYELETSNLKFTLTVMQISVKDEEGADVSIPNFEPMSMEFSMAKAQ